mgnify:CR=1 FL=1
MVFFLQVKGYFPLVFSLNYLNFHFYFFFTIFLCIDFYFLSFYESIYLPSILLLPSFLLLFGFAGSHGSGFIFLLRYFALFSLTAIFSFYFEYLPSLIFLFSSINFFFTIQKLSIIVVIFSEMSFFKDLWLLVLLNGSSVSFF